MKQQLLILAVCLPFLTTAQFGTLDNDFDADGLVSINLGSSGYTQAYDVAVQSDGKVLVIGTTGTQVGLAPFIARMFPDGSLDQTFGVNGVSVLIVNNGEFDARGMVVQPDGNMVLVGSGILDGVTGVFAMRANAADGFADATFGTNGLTLIPYPSDSYLMDVAKIFKNNILSS